jgi:predicted cupin superfamily sugar epimerase
MEPRAAELIRTLGLEPHPEGGHYVEVYRAPAVTTIYFLLTAGAKSRWHRVRADEIWHYYEGAPLELLQLTPDGGELERIVLGPLSEVQQPLPCVPGGHWLAARSRGPYSLVGCTVAPAFRFSDFTLLRDERSTASAIAARHPAAAEFV